MLLRQQNETGQQQQEQQQHRQRQRIIGIKSYKTTRLWV